VTPRPSANGKSELFDLDAAETAAVAEAQAHPFAFRYAGKSYHVPNQAMWPLETLHRFAEGDLEGTLSELLGAKVFQQLREAGLKVAGINRLFAAMSLDVAMSLPNSALPLPPVSTPT
jgi:hypothetical protein